MNLDVLIYCFVFILLWLTFLVNVSYFVAVILFVYDWIEKKLGRWDD